MEKLTEELRQKAGKMSDERLRQRLVQAGNREADVARFERGDLLAYYAKVLLVETAYVPPPQRGDDVDVEAAGGEGDADEMKVRVNLVLDFMAMKVVIFR